MTDQENHVAIIPDRCKGCEVCVSVCPKKCLAMSEGHNQTGYAFAVFSQHGCTACGLCFLSCPEIGAICVRKKDQ